MTWLLLAFVAPFLWAWVSTIDNYFVHSVYEDEFDGAIISGFFQSVPWLFVPLGLVQFQFPGVGTAWWAMGAGAFFLFSFICYFRALFMHNDSALIQILWNLSVPTVPFVAWFILSETLLPIHYAGIALAFVGVTLFVLDGGVTRDGFWKAAVPMFGAVLALSLSMVISKKAYGRSDAFWSIYLFFCLGATMLAAFLLVVVGRKKAKERAGKIIRLSGKYFWFFLLAESLSVIGTLTSQGAIRLAPAVSFIAVIEALVPVFVMTNSLILVVCFRKLRRNGMQELYQEQLAGLRTKVLAVVLIVAGIYAIS